MDCFAYARNDVLFGSGCLKIEIGVHANTLVMPGLDPGIHLSLQDALFSKKMDCRVEPGKDGVS